MGWLMAEYPGIKNHYTFDYVRPAPMSHGKIFDFVGVIQLDSPFVKEILDLEGIDNNTDLVKKFNDRGLVIRGVMEG